MRRFDNTPEGREMAQRQAGPTGYWEQYVDFWPAETTAGTVATTTSEDLVLYSLALVARDDPSVEFASDVQDLVRQRFADLTHMQVQQHEQTAGNHL